ncbi:hypothetical protein [Streptomyces sp. AGS-58]|uniref:hypothetical protein n=1 Tax=unclassified Streptomyces TaxID=2593676 RepID=UPI0035A3CDBF
MDATVLRVTPLREAVVPAHPWAMTYQLDASILFGVCIEPRSSFGPLVRAASHGLTCALLAEREHPQRHDVQAVAQGLWQRRHIGAAVEVWGEAEPGSWWYALVPWWLHEWDTAVWPLGGLEDRQAYAVGECCPVDAYDWPAPAPLRYPHSVEPTTQLVYARTPIEPPAAGLPLFTGQVT